MPTYFTYENMNASLWGYRVAASDGRLEQ